MIAAGFIPYQQNGGILLTRRTIRRETQFYPLADDAYETSMNSLKTVFYHQNIPLKRRSALAETAKTDETEEPCQISVSAIGDCVLATGYGFSFNGSFEDYMGEEDQGLLFLPSSIGAPK